MLQSTQVPKQKFRESMRRHVIAKDLMEEKRDWAQKRSGRDYNVIYTPKELKERAEKRRKDVLALIKEDSQVKTRDIWFYSTVLFLCE